MVEPRFVLRSTWRVFTLFHYPRRANGNDGNMWPLVDLRYSHICPLKLALSFGSIHYIVQHSLTSSGNSESPLILYYNLLVESESIIPWHVTSQSPKSNANSTAKLPYSPPSTPRERQYCSAVLTLTPSIGSGFMVKGHSLQQDCPHIRQRPQVQEFPGLLHIWPLGCKFRGFHS